MSEFLSALALSFDVPLDSMSLVDDQWEIVFDQDPSKDERFRLFDRLVGGKLDTLTKVYRFSSDRFFDEEEWTDFLFVTRLQEDNIKAISGGDRFKKILDRWKNNSPKDAVFFSSLDEARELIFTEVAKKEMTLRELSEKTGLSQVALSQFKAGGEVKASNLFKILGALGLGVSLCADGDLSSRT